MPPVDLDTFECSECFKRVDTTDKYECDVCGASDLCIDCYEDGHGVGNGCEPDDDKDEDNEKANSNDDHATG